MPPYRTSAGLEAIELGRSVGLVADDWQEDILIGALGETRDGQWSAFEVGVVVPRQNGKGALIELRTLAGLLLFGEKLILHSAHQFKTATEAFRRIEALFANYDDLRRRVRRVTKANGDEGIELNSGQRLRFVARSKDSARGFSAPTIILDEAYALSQDEMAALLPTMSAQPNPQLWYTSTPPLGPASVLAALRRRGKAGARRLAYFEWSPEDDYVPTPKKDPPTDRDREVWAETNPARAIRISEEFIEGEREALDDEAFGRERLGIWPAEADGEWRVISEQQWADRLDPNSEIVGNVALCLDTTPTRSHTSISGAGRRPDGDRHVELIAHLKGTAGAVREIKRIATRQPVCVVVVDAAGPAASMIPELEKVLEPLGIPLHKLGAQEAAAAFGGFVDGVCGRDPEAADDPDDDVDPTGIWHLDQLPQNLALAGADVRDLSGGQAWARKNLEVDLTPIVSATGAIYGDAKYGHLTGVLELEGSLMS